MVGHLRNRPLVQKLEIFKDRPPVFQIENLEINYGAEQAILLNKNQWIRGVPT